MPQLWASFDTQGTCMPRLLGVGILIALLSFAPASAQNSSPKGGSQGVPPEQGSASPAAPAPGKSEKDNDPPKNGRSGQSGGNTGQGSAPPAAPAPGKSEKDSDPPKNGANPVSGGQTPPPGQNGGSSSQSGGSAATPTPGKPATNNDPPK